VLGKDDAVALSFGGFALGYAGGDIEGGLAMLDRALVLNPNLAATWTASGILRTYRGDHDLAIEHIARATRLSPLDPLMFFTQSVAAFAHFFAGQYDEGLQLAERACQEQPNYVAVLRVAAANSARAGRLKEARRFVARTLELDPELRLSNLKDRMRALSPERFARYVDAVREAGLPE
jgi:tetratricopeptide (TPR) repeat protein